MWWSGSGTRELSVTLRTRTQGLTARSGPALAAIWVVAESGSGAAVRVRVLLKEGRLRIGVSGPCELVLDDPAVSRERATVEHFKGSVRTRDLSSRNETRYLDARIDEARVPFGGAVQVGRTTLRFVPPLDAGPTSERTELAGLVGGSPAMRTLYGAIERVAPTDLTVLFEGAAGTGTGIRTTAAAPHFADGRYSHSRSWGTSSSRDPR